jgi:hypothetical protein
VRSSVPNRNIQYLSIIAILKQILKGPHAEFRFKFRVPHFESVPRDRILIEVIRAFSSILHASAEKRH